MLNWTFLMALWVLAQFTRIVNERPRLTERGMSLLTMVTVREEAPADVGVAGAVDAPDTFAPRTVRRAAAPTEAAAVRAGAVGSSFDFSLLPLVWSSGDHLRLGRGESVAT
ncbi:hypothetical protein ASJ30_14725 [Janibacter indicus]|uniref:Uncharacterized protein n=1 Tax=Janibacter indicus TaxID=857417 RepID=A0A1L3MJW2_9MICO|nr:hypothetical protein ASJ30_14725 [Janibacter indicus]